jgi:hypothetical protein
MASLMVGDGSGSSLRSSESEKSPQVYTGETDTTTLESFSSFSAIESWLGQEFNQTWRDLKVVSVTSW